MNSADDFLKRKVARECGEDLGAVVYSFQAGIPSGAEALIPFCSLLQHEARLLDGLTGRVATKRRWIRTLEVTS